MALAITLVLLISCGGNEGPDESTSPPGLSTVDATGGSEKLSGVWNRSWEVVASGTMVNEAGQLSSENGATVIWNAAASPKRQSIKLFSGVFDEFSIYEAESLAGLFPNGATLVTSLVIRLERMRPDSPFTIRLDSRQLPIILIEEGFLAYRYALNRGEEDEVMGFRAIATLHDRARNEIEFEVQPGDFTDVYTDSSMVEVVIQIFKVTDLEAVDRPEGASGVLVVSEGVGKFETAAAASVDDAKQVSGSSRNKNHDAEYCPAETNPLVLPTERGWITSLYGWPILPPQAF